MLLSEAKQILKKNGYRLTEARRDISFKRNRISDIKKIVAENTKHLKVLIAEEIKKNGPNCSLNHIDVSKITDMSNMFSNSKFNGDISKWDVSNVTDMYGMFHNSDFDGDISKWDVSNVTNMEGMFEFADFNGDISNWNLNDEVEWDDLKFPEDSLMYKKIQLLNRKKMVKDI